MPLPIEAVKTFPRISKRRIWLGWWKHQRDKIPGATRAEKRQNWRAIWGKLATPNKA